MLTDRKIAAAISSISQRAERIIDDNKIIQTYVEVGILPQLTNKNNQIIYGRRGTGKTHLFRYLENELKNSNSSIVVYIDCRTLGSAADYNNQSIAINRRCMSLFRDIIDQLYDKALHFIVYEAPKDAEKAIEALENIYRSASFRNDEIWNTETTERNLKKITTEGNRGISFSPKDFVNVTMGGKDQDQIDTEKTIKYNTSIIDKILFPDLFHWLKKLSEFTGAQVYFLIDEWSSLPIEIQPYLAEFFKRSFLPLAQISIKIAALEYRSQFTIPQNRNNHIGFELGSDISTNLDLDDYYVFDRNPGAITANFAEILFKHIYNELEEGFFQKEYTIKTANDFIRTIFADSNNFQELVRASEGVIRDMINIFTLSYFDTQRQGKAKIDKKSVIESSRQWFERDKAQNLDDNLSKVLRKIVDEVIGNKKARSFLIPRELEKHENIQKLFDARVIHFIKRGYADKDNPGVRYNVFGLDYGTYVDLLTTNKKPELDFVSIDFRKDNEDFIVPFDDKRSIRRIVLTEETLNY